MIPARTSRAPRVPRRTRRTLATRSQVLRGLRLAGVSVTGVAAAGALAAVAALGGPWVQGWTGDEARALAAVSRAVVVEPAAEMLVCPPPARLPEGADVGDEQFSAVPVGTRTALAAGVLGGAGPARLTGLDGASPGGGEPVELPADAVAAIHADVAATTALHAQPAAEAPFRAAGAVASITTDGDLRGLAAARCTAAATSHWLVGGSTDVGSTARLTVQNPSPRPAAVTLEAYGPGGVVPLGGKGSFAVAPGQEVSTRLESVAPDQGRLVLHVRAAGARVTASLQTQAIDGLLPAGTELVAPGAAPATTVAVAGITSAGEAVDDPRAPRLRLLAPGRQPGAANVSLYGPDGPVTLRGAERIALEPGVVTDVPLGGLAEGAYAVVVDAEVPIVAAGIVVAPGELPEDSVLEGTPHDVAWSAGQPVLEETAESDGPVVAPPEALGQVAVPAGVRADVVLQAVPAERGPDAEPAGTTTVTLRAYGADGTELGSTELELAAGTSAVVPGADLGGADGKPALVVADRTGGDPLGVVWAATLTADDGTDSAGTLRSVVVPTPAQPTPGDVTVRQVDAWR